MDKLFDFILNGCRFSVKKLGLDYRPNYDFDFSGDASSQKIAELIASNEPFLVARIGATEFECLSGYLNEKKGGGKYLDYITGKTSTLNVNKDIISQANLWSGIFPASKQIVENFAKLTLTDIEQIDLIGLWLKEPFILADSIKKMVRIPLADIEPYYHQHPWSKELEGKKVLVIHPFEESIKQQYAKHRLLFENKEVLPHFDLKTIKAVQTIAGQPNDFKDWFEALDHMKSQMDSVDYDIALIGCGAYGLSLGAHAKRMGKQAIHMGGATQILFGIKGARWDAHPVISNLYNEHWIRPSKNETPAKKDVVEDGCYW